MPEESEVEVEVRPAQASSGIRLSPNPNPTEMIQQMRLLTFTSASASKHLPLSWDSRRCFQSAGSVAWLSRPWALFGRSDAWELTNS